MSRTARRKARDIAERDELIERYLPLVRHIVGRLTYGLPPGVDRDDLQATGAMGLIRAAETWEPDKGASFKTFAYTAIRGAILDELRRLDPVPRTTRERLRRLERSWQDLTAELGRNPTHDEVCDRLACSREELGADLVALHTSNQLSIDDNSGTYDDDATLIDTIVSERATDPGQKAQDRESIESVHQAIGSLPEQARRAVVLYYDEGLLLKDIGSLLGVSESRVCQILAQAIATLKLTLVEPEPCKTA
ncbi:MAG: FliA/WhiG family RNA polymerase sigma factor [Planctomycetes bacterium]|nr:FliA/WhiG family RNA polymerase sigma factor [Planctomycetota bacterium]